MTPKQEAAARQALEALEKIGLRGWVERKEAAITALREALAEQQAAEPVAVTGCSYCLNKTAYKLTPTCTECGHDMLTAPQLEAAQALIDPQAAQALGKEGGAAC